MKGYIVYGKNTKTNENIYIGTELDDGDFVGEIWSTNDPSEVRVFFDKSQAESEAKDANDYVPNVEVAPVEVDITSPNLPREMFGIDQIDTIKQLCEDIDIECNNVWSKNSEKIRLICKQSALLKEAVSLMNTLKYRVSVPAEWDPDYKDDLELKNRVENFLKKAEEVKIV